MAAACGIWLCFPGENNKVFGRHLASQLLGGSVSYCRFSSDHWKCDVYVYDDIQGGITIHVAKVRFVSDIPFPAPPKNILELPATDGVAWLAREQEWLKHARRKKIELPHAGKTFNVDTDGDAAKLLQELAALGYFVPKHVIRALRQTTT